MRNFPHLAEFSLGKEVCAGPRACGKISLTGASILPRMALNTLERRNVPQIYCVLEGRISFVAYIALAIS